MARKKKVPADLPEAVEGEKKAPCAYADQNGCCDDPWSNSPGAKCSFGDCYVAAKVKQPVINSGVVELGDRVFFPALPLDGLRPSPYQTRKEVRDIDELAASLKAIGMLNPVTARKTDEGEGYELIAGHRRVEAAKAAGWTTVPAFVVTCDSQTAAEMCATENMQRTDLTPLEEAESVRILLERHPMQEVADRLGRPRQWVARRAALKGLVPEAKYAYADEECNFSRVSLRGLEMVAAMPPDLQATIVEAVNERYGMPPTTSAIADLIQTEHMRDLKRAPFNTDECSQCPKRTGAAPDLFDGEETCELGRCLDSECFKVNTEEAIKRKAAQHKTAHPRERLVAYDYHVSQLAGVECVASWRTCKKGTKGAVKASAIGEDGKISTVWLPPEREDKPSEAETPKQPTPEQKLMAKVVKVVEGLLENTVDAYHKAKRNHPFYGRTEAFILRAMLVTGTNFRHDISDACEWNDSVEWTGGDMEDRAWEAVQHMLVLRLRFDAIIRCEGAYAEALQIGKRFFEKTEDGLREAAK